MAESRKPGAHNDLEQQTISPQDRPALDEATFQQLLEAAHVIQELKAFEVAGRPKSDPAEALAKIVETQDLLRSQAGDLHGAAKLIAERLLASGIKEARLDRGDFEGPGHQAGSCWLMQ